MPSLLDLLLAAGVSAPEGTVDRDVVAVTQDSRDVRPGSLFVAVPGEHVDGHDYAAAAVAAGAVAVVVQRAVAEALPVPVFLVPDTQAALAPLAAAASGHPSAFMTVAGITGTDGKTTTTTLLHAAWRGAGVRAAALTTVDFRVDGDVEPNRTRQTTLEAPALQLRLAAALQRGCTHAAVETSSHALVLHRVDALDFRVAVVLRVTSEHLDLHGTRAAYLAAKALLVERVGERPDGIAVLDADDDDGFAVMARIPVASRLTVSAAGRPGADCVAESVESSPAGVRFRARTPWGDGDVRLRLAGRFNAGNALAALCAACATGATLAGAVAGIEGLDSVGGRMERVDAGDGLTVVIDYAHTTEALERVLTELRAATPGRLWVVFGSAGERDREKRPAMGAMAARLADVVVVTDEDPRNEDGAAILEEIAAGARRGGAIDDRLLVIADRTTAIAAAVTAAAPGDTVLCAGKGHESTILGPDGATPWSERGAVAAAVAQRNGRRPGTPSRRG